MKRIAVVCLATITTMACDMPATHTTVTEPSTQLNVVPLGELDVPGGERYRGESPEVLSARADLLDRVSDDVEHVRSVLRSDDAFEDKHARISAVLAGTASDPARQWFVDHLVATEVVEFLLEQATARDDRYLKYYVRTLVGRRSPNAPLIYAGLKRIEGTLEKPEVASLAMAALEAAEAHLEQCDECDVKKAGGKGLAKTTGLAQEDNRSMIREAIEALRVLMADAAGH